MKDNGLFALCGVPGSGKTLTSVYLALKHYKKENSRIKFYIAYIKYICLNNKFIHLIIKILTKYNFISIVKKKYRCFCMKICNKHIVNLLNVLIKMLKYFIKFIILIYIFVTPSWFTKIFLFIMLFYVKSIKKWFNSLDYEYICSFPCKKINNVYSTFPILLDKKHNIYSNKVTLWDLLNESSFLPNSVIIIDEIQLFVDSDEYKDKIMTLVLRRLGNFMQAHRHFGIKNIYVTSQGVTRVFKKCRDVCSGYLKLNKVIKVPFIPFGMISGTIYYDIDYYGKYIPKSREERKKLPFEFKKIRLFCNMKKIYFSYDSRYLANMNYSKPLLNRGLYTDLCVSNQDLKNLFINPRGE